MAISFDCFFPARSSRLMQNERKNPDHPRHFGQRVGLVRQYFPKKTDFSKVTLSETMIAVDRLNHRPRKCLDFKIPF
jgi:hypothetical protein